MANEELTPSKLFEISGSYWKSFTLHAAVELEIFSIIGDGLLGGEEIVKRLGADLRGTQMLLNALVAMGLLIKEDEKYKNTKVTKTCLVKTSPKYSGHIIMHHKHLVETWGQLNRAIITGKPIDKRSVDEDKARESFQMGMFNLAMNIAPDLSSQIDLTGRRHLLDLGGGPGTYAIHFCLANPDLKATIFDLTTTKPFALKTIEKFGLGSRIDFIGGDYIDEDIPGTYDVAWLSHILHSQGPDECRQIIQKTISCLKPGGLILVHDFLLNDTLDGPVSPALFSLNMLINTSNGQSYSETQIKDMLALAGVKEIKRLAFRGPNDSGIIQGII